MPDMEEWDEKQLLAFEKESLGFYITGHPLTRYEEALDKFTNASTVSLKEKKDGEGVRIGGIVRQSKIIKTKKGDLMAFVTIEDMHGSVEITVFSSIYMSVSDLLGEDNPIIVQGRVQRDENSVKLLADQIILMDNAEETWTAKIHFTIDMTRAGKELLAELLNILKRHPGSCRAYLQLLDPEKTETIIELPETIKLKAGSALTKDVNGLVGYPCVETLCSPVSSGAASNNYNNYNRRNNRKKYHGRV
jgi:DNA polymerase-3 subunit alpha